MNTIQFKTLKIKNALRNHANRQFFSVIIVFILITLLYKWVLNIVILGKIFTPTSQDTKLADNKFTSSRLVWPEELPDGDRIREQMFYVPKGYEYEKTPLKRILIYTGIGDVWERPSLGQGQFVGCPVSQCWLTVDKSYGPEVDAVLFRHYFIQPPYERPPGQIWIIELTEAPPHSSSLQVPANAINWTATYRWDSDIPRPYGYFMEYRQQLPNQSMYYPNTKTKKVAWFVSNCNSRSNREVYAKELAKYIDVDVYGRCGDLQCPRSNESGCLEMLENTYKFYLSFENSHCRHYITEKLFLNGLSYRIVPIVLGASREEYELIAPKNSFIHVDDYASPQELAEYLHKVDKDDSLYEEYFKWRDTGTMIIETRFYCRLCAMLHDKEHKPKSYEDINAWWRGKGVCQDNPMIWRPKINP